MMPKKHNYPTDRAPTGPRPTAGAPRKVAQPVRVTFTLEADQAEWLVAQGDKSAVVRALIDAARIANEPKKPPQRPKPNIA